MPRPVKTFQSSNIPKPLDKGKGKIEKIDFGVHTEDVMRIWSGLPPRKLEQKWKETGVKGSYTPGTPLARMNKIKALIGYSSNLAGHCCQCYAFNTHLVKYKTQGITIVERYCDKCFTYRKEGRSQKDIDKLF